MHRFSTSSPCVWFLIGILASFTLLFIPLSVQHVSGASVTLAWDPNPEGNLAGYKVYYGTASGSYSIKVDVGNWTSLTVSNLEAGRTYYFAATAYDTGGEESGKSNELRYDTPGPDSRSLSPAQASNGTDSFTIYASAGPNGSISSSGYITVRRGSSKTYIIRPRSGYRVGRVYIDGVSMNYVTSHTFRQINASHTIRAEFEPIRSNNKKPDVPKPLHKGVENFDSMSFEKGDATCVALSCPGAAFRKSPECSSSTVYISPTSPTGYIR